jgi:hypothetical protein
MLDYHCQVCLQTLHPICSRGLLIVTNTFSDHRNSLRIFATKTEECRRKLRGVAKVCHSKTAFHRKLTKFPARSVAKEVLLEALCFGFVIDSPNAVLVDSFDAHDVAY